MMYTVSEIVTYFPSHSALLVIKDALACFPFIEDHAVHVAFFSSLNLFRKRKAAPWHMKHINSVIRLASEKKKPGRHSYL